MKPTRNQIEAVVLALIVLALVFITVGAEKQAKSKIADMCRAFGYFEVDGAVFKCKERTPRQ